jgi:hypothetical protein
MKGLVLFIVEDFNETLTDIEKYIDICDMPCLIDTQALSQ